MNVRKILKSLPIYFLTGIIMLGNTPIFARDVESYTRLEQPKVSYTFQKDELAVVNFKSTWGNKEANIKKMKEYIEEAAKKNVKILVFPEMCVTGYAASSDVESETYKMPIALAESKHGPTGQIFAALAKEKGMWIIYGATEKIEGDKAHAYNSAFVCSPDGKVETYQKITPVEGSWCQPGETPLLVDAGEYGLLGISICYDTYATPELSRYYAAKGCNILINPTATSRSYKDIDGDDIADDIGWEWYYKNRLESIASRDGLTILSANLVGADGPVGEDGKQVYNFPGGSVIMNGSFNGTKYYAGTIKEEEAVSTNHDIVTGVAGLLTNSSEVSATTGSTCSNQDFNIEYYAKWYANLADKMEDGETLSYNYTNQDGPIAAVVNMPGVWGDKEANIEGMIKYIEEAAKKNVEVLVFPETVLTGYEYQDPLTDSLTQTDKPMQVALAETIPGVTTKRLSEYAQKYNMYIIFGMPEKEEEPMYENGVEKVYNSAAILYPDGTIDAYQKMHRAGDESLWSVRGETPVIIETKWGKFGIDICRDGHFYPELGRYYAALGCNTLIHPTATTGNPWYRETRIGSYTDRDNMAAITCNLLGPDGTYNEETGEWSGGIFNSTSLIITKYHDQEGRTSFDYNTGYAIDLNGTGSASVGYAERGTSPEGLEIAKMNLSGTGFRITNFNPRLFSKMYDELAVLYRKNYKSIYNVD